ncbi:MAG: GMC family oxidoreductase [Gemmatimonadetes bacterium]|nr:GMC family oxidoreductase [Gemmatimonadota bacterium]
MSRRVIEADVAIVGSGISAAMVAEKLTDERRCSVVVIEAGSESDPLRTRPALRRRYLDYGESPWHDDHIDGCDVVGQQSRSMQVGGLAMHWGGVTPRFSPEDFRIRSLWGIHADWPISYDDLDRHYQEAEERIGVAGEQGPPAMDPRGRPFPQPALPLNYNLLRLQEWAAEADIATWSQPSAKNSIRYRGRPACCRNDTCFPSCPIGAKYSPDFSWDALRAAGRVELVPRTVVRRLECAADSPRIERAVAISRDRPDLPLEIRAGTFVVAAGYLWSSHLLLASRDHRFPDGLANRSGLVGKYLCGHRNLNAFVSLPMPLFPGINEQHSLVSKQFMRMGNRAHYLRHDLRIWESAVGQGPRLRDDAGRLLLGDAWLADWRGRTKTGTARVRSYYDVLPDRASEITLDPARRTPWGDPMPVISWRDAPESIEYRASTEAAIRTLFDRMARVGRGKVESIRVDEFQDHPAGGCRMGVDGATSVTDSWGRSHDHENLFVVGAPTCVSASCANGTLTFAALSLRSAEQIGSAFPARNR